MGTASRTGILGLTFVLSVAGNGVSTALLFHITAAVLVGWIVVLTLFFESTPPPLPPRDGSAVGAAVDGAAATPEATGGALKATAAKSGGVAGELFGIVMQPMFVLAMLVQATATPIAEFQSQLALFLDDDPALTATHRTMATTAWHLGTLFAVLGCGWLLDKASMLQRGMLIGLPMLLNSALFLGAYVAKDSMFAGLRKIPLTLMLGATYAPAQYLVMNTFAMRHAPRHLMATASSIIDLFGYAGTVVVLQFSKELHSTGSSTVDGTLYASGVSGAVCFAAVISLYILEHRFDSSGRQKEMAGKIE